MKFKFTNKEDYMNQRNALIEQATGLVNEGKLEDAKAAKEDVVLMDSEWEAYAEAMADIAALNDKTSVRDLANVATKEVAGQVAGSIGKIDVDDDMTNSIAYRTAFMNNVMRGTATPANL